MVYPSDVGTFHRSDNTLLMSLVDLRHLILCAPFFTSCEAMEFAKVGHRWEEFPNLPVSLLMVLHALQLEWEKSIELTFLRTVTVAQGNRSLTILLFTVKSIDFTSECMTWLFWMTRHLNACSTLALRSSAACLAVHKNWFKWWRTGASQYFECNCQISKRLLPVPKWSEKIGCLPEVCVFFGPQGGVSKFEC